ncbi:MAG: 2-phospho-L-lactate transferase [Actinomycetota bacterium]
MDVVSLAGGIGAGKFLRGLRRVVGDEHLTVIGNTGDDLVVHGLHVSPDLDSVLYWLSGTGDRSRGWGRGDETFRTVEELRRLDPDAAWFTLGDLDLATHLFRTGRLRAGTPLSRATADLVAAFGLTVRLLPMSDDRVETRILVGAGDDEEEDLHLQEYWVRRGGRDPVRSVRFDGAAAARPAPGVLEAIAAADVVVIGPSNPVVSIGPILAVPGIREAVAAHRPTVVGVSGIVNDAPLGGMADRMLPAVGREVTAAGAAACYEGLLGGWLLDDADAVLVPRIEATGVRVATADTLMTDDDAAERVARAVLGLLS